MHKAGTKKLGPAAQEAAMTGRSLSDLTRTVSVSDLDTMLEEEETACATLCASVPTPLIVLGAVLAWLLGGAGVYSWLNDWPFLQSYYYAVNVGWSIGFGALVEQNDASRLFSVLMICLGAGAVGGGLGYFVQLNLEASDDFAAKVRERESKRLVFGVDNDGDGDVDATDFFLFVWQSARRAYKEHRVRINCFVALAVWLLVGIVFGLFNQGWTFVTSLYFAVSSLSTGGLQGVNTRVTDAGVTLLTGKGGNALVSLFTGLYTMTGVPVFGVALGQFAGFFVDSYVQKREEAAMARVLSRDEFDYMRGLGTSAAAGGGGRARESIDFGAFMALELLRLQKVDRGMIATIRDEFDKRDRDGSGDITWEEVEKYHAKQGLLRLGRAAEAKLLMKRKGMTAARAKLKAFQMPDEHVIQRASARHIEMAREMRPDTAFDAEHL